MTQLASAVLMVRPARFGFNAGTAETNVLQHPASGSEALAQQAREEFDRVVDTLARHRIRVHVLDERPGPPAPDAVFPNNWFSTHASGKLILYPMMAPSRRVERRADLGRRLAEFGYRVAETADLSPAEKEGKFLEGTGSLVFDHVDRTAFAALSARTDGLLAERVCRLLGYAPFLFHASLEGREIYHTNVLLSVAEGFAVVAAGCVEAERRDALLERLSAGGRNVLQVTPEQVKRYCANLLAVRNEDGDPVIVLSETAWRAFTPEQRRRLESHGTAAVVSVPTIEKHGGGGVRCMMAEIFLEKIKANL